MRCLAAVMHWESLTFTYDRFDSVCRKLPRQAIGGSNFEVKSTELPPGPKMLEPAVSTHKQYSMTTS